METPEEKLPFQKEGTAEDARKKLWAELSAAISLYHDPQVSRGQKHGLKEFIDKTNEEAIAKEGGIERAFHETIGRDASLNETIRELPKESVPAMKEFDYAALKETFTTSPQRFLKYHQWLQDLWGEFTKGVTESAYIPFEASMNARIQEYVREIENLNRIIKQEFHIPRLSKTDLADVLVDIIQLTLAMFQEVGVQKERMTEDKFHRWLQSKRFRQGG